MMPSEPTAQPDPATAPEQQAAALDAKLAGPIEQVLDAEVRELSDAWNQMMQVPGNAGELLARKYGNALSYVMQARDHLRPHP